MKTLYLSCEMGAAGDMLMAALYELLPEKQAFLERMNSLLHDVKVTAEASEKCGICGTHMAVSIHGTEEDEHLHDHDHDHEHDHEHEHEHHHHDEHDHEHHQAHSGMGEIEHIISHLPLPERVKEDIRAVYGLIARAESTVHGKPVTEIHFHEVGTLDAVADVAGVCFLMHLLAPEQVLCSSVHVGSGQVRCAHGLMPVPAPATALLLEGVPIYGGSVKGELCTPTGAALLKHFVSAFGPMPVMTLEKTGYGMGKKNFEAANCVRALWGETEENSGDVLELRCNLDDMSPEDLAYARERLFAAGALDVCTLPLDMKKDRSGALLLCLCRPGDRETMIQLLFRHTNTLGVREVRCARHTLTRREEAIETEYGPVRMKISEGYGIRRCKAEYEDLARIAREQDLSLEEVRNLTLE